MLQVFLDVPGELFWAAQRWAAVESLSISCSRPIPECAMAVLSDPTALEPLPVLNELEVLMIYPHEEEHLRSLLDGVLSRAPNVRALSIDAFEVLTMPRLSDLKHLMVTTCLDLYKIFCDSLKELCSLETLYIADSLLEEEGWLASIAHLDLQILPALSAVVIDNVWRESLRLQLPGDCILDIIYGCCRTRYRYPQTLEAHAESHILQESGPIVNIGGFAMHDPSKVALIDFCEDPDERMSAAVEHFKLCFTADFVSLREIFLESVTVPIVLELQCLPKLITLVARAGRKLQLESACFQGVAKMLTTLQLSWVYCNIGVNDLVRAMEAKGKTCLFKKLKRGRKEVVYPEGACLDRCLRPCTCRACKECLERDGNWPWTIA